MTSYLNRPYVTFVNRQASRPRQAVSKSVTTRDIIVIGASAGGVEATCELLRAAGPKLDACIFVVQHLGQTSVLPDILSKCDSLMAVHPRDAEPIRRGRVYVAPPNFHMLLEDGRIRLSKGPRENRHRPSVDALFRSAARSYKSRVIAIVLSGALDDGSAGAFIVKERGGIVIVQDPDEAPMPDMPRNVMRTVSVDGCAPVRGIAQLLRDLTSNKLKISEKKRSIMKKRVNLRDALPEKTLVPIVCPECNGPLHLTSNGKALKCEVGHTFSPASMGAAHAEALERTLWTAIRTLRERVTLHETLADNNATENPTLAERFHEQAQEAEKDAALLREILDRLDAPVVTHNRGKDGNIPKRPASAELRRDR